MLANREVTTIEGLHPTGDHPVQKAWRQLNVPQCGFCQVGQIMQALLVQNPKPSHDQIREAMSSAMALNLSLGALGNVRTETMRAFSAAEMTNIVGKML
jgi:xanthine dehydrogenase iron-sulfur cluster and FAD-binding subunit A